MKSYIAITPARDEERLLPRLLVSMVAQTRRPERWIVIDDGSTDRTGEILDRAAHYHPWIEPQHLPRGGARAPGGESVIMRFLPRETWEGYDAILRLDADLTFKPQFAELLLAEMEKDPRLGIAGPRCTKRKVRDGARFRRHRSIPSAPPALLQRMLRRDRRP